MTKITWMGNASFLFQNGEDSILVDPFVQFPGGEHPNHAVDFAVAKDIFITHGHLDHMCSVPEILKVQDATIYTTKGPAQDLRKRVKKEFALHIVEVNMPYEVGKLCVKAKRGKHVKFDRGLICRTIFSSHMWSMLSQGIRMGKAMREYKEYGEIVLYEIKVDGKTIQCMGSLGLDPSETYQTGADVLILPYQGNSDLPACAYPVIATLRPKKVILSHFDNAFPPISRAVNTDTFFEMMKNEFPDIAVQKPEYGVPIIV